MTPVDFDPFSFSLQDDPYPVYRTLRNEYPVFHNADRDFFALSRYDDVREVEQNWRVFSHAQGVDLDDFGEVVGEGDFLEMDPPRHDHLRGVVRSFFTPRAVSRLEPAIRKETHQLLALAADSDRVDLAGGFAWKLPMAVISSLLGFPREDRGVLLRLLHEMEAREDGSDRVPKQAREAASELRGYFRAQIADRRRTPGADLVSAIAAGSESDGKRLAAPVAEGMCFLLFVAGVSTAASLIANSLRTLASRRDLRERLVAAASLLPGAIEEFLRYESPIQMFKKTTTEAVVVHGVAIPAGATVVQLYASANRDERVYTDADSLILDRTFERRHLAFGGGIHSCLGAHLARLEAKVAMEEFLDSAADYELDGDMRRLHMFQIRGLLEVPARVEWKRGAPRTGMGSIAPVPRPDRA